MRERIFASAIYQLFSLTIMNKNKKVAQDKQ